VERERPQEAVEALARAFAVAEENNYTDVLAEAVVGAARLLAAHDPQRLDEAIGLLQDILTVPTVSARVRDDANALIALRGRGAPVAPKGQPVSLAQLVTRGRAAVAAFSSVLRGAPAPAPSHAPATTRA